MMKNRIIYGVGFILLLSSLSGCGPLKRRDIFSIHYGTLEDTGVSLEVRSSF